MTDLSKKFQTLKTGVAEGMRKIQASTGGTQAELPDDVKIYNNLQPDDFNTLVRKFGEKNVLSYIQEMEVERIKRSKQYGR